MNALTVVALLTLAAMAGADADGRLYDLNQADSLFEEFIKNYNREYKDAADREEHFNAFKTNLAVINEQNSKSAHATFGINKFADYTEKEREMMRGFKRN